MGFILFVFISTFLVLSFTIAFLVWQKRKSDEKRYTVTLENFIIKSVVYPEAPIQSAVNQ